MRKGRVLLLSLVVPVVFLVAGIATRNDVGETWDEQFDQDIGRFYVHSWPEKGVKGLEERFIPLQRNYGPFFDVLIVRGHELLHDKLKLVTNNVASYHMPVLVVASIGLWIVFWFGYRLFGLGPGLLASLALALMPQVIAHSQNNLKDTPLTAFFTLGLFLFYEAVRRDRLWLYALAGVIAGLTYTIKVHAIFLFAIVFLWQLSELRWGRRPWLRFASGLALSLAAALATIPIAWPYYRHAFLLRFKETFATFSHHEYNEYVFYLGQHYRAREVPWHFPFVMLAVNTPLVYLFFLGAALAILLWRIVRLRRDRSPLVLLTLWLFLPPVAQIASGAAMLDGVRHYLLVLPAWALLASFAAFEIGRWLRARSAPLAAGFAAATLTAFAVVLAKDIAIHPYQVVFFNRLAGGIHGASTRFELDYWGVSLKEAAEWMNKNLPEGSRIWLPMPGQHFFKIDRSRLRFVDSPNRVPNYKVNLVRGLLKTFDTEEDYRHPKRLPIYAVRVDGADLLQVFEYPQNRELPNGTEIAPLSPSAPTGAPGLAVQVYRDSEFTDREGDPVVWSSVDFDCNTNVFSGRASAARAEGLLAIPAAGTYLFEVYSDDDTMLFLNGKVALANASQATTRRTLRLGSGSYRIRVDYRNDVGPACLRVTWALSGDPLKPLAAPALVH
jgi:hypothetical protein